MRRVLPLVVAGLLAGACGQGAPGGFASAPTSPSASTTNTIPQGSAAPAPTSSRAVGDAQVTVTLARGSITAAVTEVKVGKVAFVISNDDEVARSMNLANSAGTALGGVQSIPPGQVGTLTLDLVAGRYRLVAEGGGKSRASVDLTVSP